MLSEKRRKWKCRKHKNWWNRTRMELRTRKGKQHQQNHWAMCDPDHLQGRTCCPLTVLTAVSSCRLPQDLCHEQTPSPDVRDTLSETEVRRPSHRGPPWMGNTHPLGYHQVDQGFVGADSQFGQSVCPILLIPSSTHRWRSLRNTMHPRLHLSICFWRIQAVTVGTRGDPRKQEVRWGFGAESPAIWLATRNPSQCLVAHTAPGTRQHANWNFQRCSVGDCASGSGWDAPGVEDLEWPEAVRIMGWMILSSTTDALPHSSHLISDCLLLTPQSFWLRQAWESARLIRSEVLLILVRRPKRSTAVQKFSRRGGGGKAAGSQTWKQRTCWRPTKRLPAAAARGQAARLRLTCRSSGP